MYSAANCRAVSSKLERLSGSAQLGVTVFPLPAILLRGGSTFTHASTQLAVYPSSVELVSSEILQSAFAIVPKNVEPTRASPSVKTGMSRHCPGKVDQVTL